MNGFAPAALCLLMTSQVGAADLALWYEQPADPGKWEQALPLGNGRLGAMVFGGIDRDVLILNEDSLWSGWPEPGNDREGAFDALVEIRRLLKSNGDQQEVKRLALGPFCSLHGYGKPDFGAYQAFCDAEFDFGHDPAAVSGYRRELDLETAVAAVTYSLNGVDYTREYFCSYPDNVLVVRFTASERGRIAFTLGASSRHGGTRVSAGEGALVLNGQVTTGSKEHPGTAFQAVWDVRAEGGRVGANEAGDRLVVEEADAVTIVMAGATDYALGYPHYKGDAPGERNKVTLGNIGGRPFATLRSTHVGDHQELFERMELTLGNTSRPDLPTDRRLAAYRKSRDDHGLEALLFQYGRYLLIASSRSGAMPANLQGLWNKSNTPAWNCDYHLNINFQMNYWPVNLCNLTDCAEPMIRWTRDLVRPGARTAEVHYRARGWVVHHTANAWGFTSPGPNRGVHMLEAESGAFLCRNIWDYYAFTLDRAYLEREGWPILKGAAEFWMDNLQETADGHLAVSPSYSPEHGPLTDGAYYQTMIVWDLFSNCIRAAEILGKDRVFAGQLEATRARIQPPKIGKYGQLCEWRDPALEENVRADRHRHVSHMYAVYPGQQIIPGEHDELTAAAIQSMNYRGDAATGWSMGWKINLWARLLDGDRAHTLIRNFISDRTYANLWCAHPPFQIDGNFGYTAGVAEMLVQSHTGEIALLPALPSAWKHGRVRGLCARGGFVLDMQWEDRELVSAILHSRAGAGCTVRYGGIKRELETSQGQTIRLRGRHLIIQQAERPVIPEVRR